VLDATEQKARAEAVRCKAVDDGVPVLDIARATYGEKRIEASSNFTFVQTMRAEDDA
jgi:hypothetical protein